jgi:hypothetical protein
MMKFYFIYLIAFLAVLLLLMLSLGCTCAMGAIPYSGSVGYSSFEGFSDLNPSYLNGTNPPFTGSYNMETSSNLLDSIQQQISAMTTSGPTTESERSSFPTMASSGMDSHSGPMPTMASLGMDSLSGPMPTMASLGGMDSLSGQIPTMASLGIDSLSKSMEGFSLSEAGAYTQSEKPIDHYSQLPGSLNCAGYGYFNSLGNICMDSAGTNMLKTRGGNQTGASSQIGMSSA